MNDTPVNVEELMGAIFEHATDTDRALFAERVFGDALMTRAYSTAQVQAIVHSALGLIHSIELLCYSSLS